MADLKVDALLAGRADTLLANAGASKALALGPKAGQAGGTEKAKAEQAATQFEALLLQQMMKSMWATVPQDKLMGSGNEEMYYRDMLSEALADNISKYKSIGVKEVLLKEFNKEK
ncbi:MAG: rod-binding protein [Oligoflexia bacterium]|nr:rod-binding protein [Oligoflexia bacterium]